MNWIPFTVTAAAAAAYVAEVGVVYYPLIGLAAGHVAWQISSVDFDNSADCMKKFVSNQAVGGLVFLACVAGKLTA